MDSGIPTPLSSAWETGMTVENASFVGMGNRNDSRECLMKNLIRQANKMGCELIITETGEVVS